MNFDSELPGKKSASPDGDELTHAGSHVKSGMLTFAPSCTHCNLHLLLPCPDRTVVILASRTGECERLSGKPGAHTKHGIQSWYNFITCTLFPVGLGWASKISSIRTVVPQRAGQDKARQGTARHGTARHRKAKQSKAQTQAQAQSRFHGASHSNFQVPMERPTHTAYITQPVTRC